MIKLFLPAGALLLAGLLTISSVSGKLFEMQLLWASFGVLLVLISLRVNLAALIHNRSFVWGLYALSVVLLILAYFFAPTIRNTRSWLFVGSFTFQPVELAKLALILVYAHYFGRRHLAVAQLRSIVTSFFVFALPAGLTVLQPDLGSASVLFAVWFGFLLVSGLPRGRVLAAFGLIAVAGLIGWKLALKDYQRDRIVAVFRPQEHALSTNYSAIQSKIAIGSAGLFGKGYRQGPQTQLGFLTEPANDFVLAAFIEEWGLLAGFGVLAAFSYLVYAILRIGLTASHNFEQFICLGAAVVLGAQFLLNAGSEVGIVPVVGVTFPFMSYGGSSLLTVSALLAIVHAIAKRT